MKNPFLLCLLHVFSLLTYILLFATSAFADESETLLEQGVQRLQEGNFTEAMELFQASGRLGNDTAINKLGNMWRNGQGVPRNDFMSKRYYELAALMGNKFAQHNLAWQFYNGEGTISDLETALFWMRESCSNGYAKACQEVSYMMKKRGIDPQSEIAMLKAHAQSGNLEAQVQFGDLHYSGKIVPQDYREAKKWFELAAERGDDVAQNRLGNLYHDGKGVPRDFNKSFFWYTKSAQNGNKFAQYNLGNSYYHGDGVDRDIEKALFWLEKSCMNGFSKACKDIAIISGKKGQIIHDERYSELSIVRDQIKSIDEALKDAKR